MKVINKKNLIIFSLLLVLFSFFSAGVAQAADKGVELIMNGEVTSGTDYWGIFAQDPAQAEIKAANEEIQYVINNVGANSWHVQGTYAGLELINENTYQLSFSMRSSKARDIEVRIQKDSSPYTGYFQKTISLTEEMQEFNFSFQMTEETDSTAKLCFNIGKVGDSDKLGSHTIYVDDLSLVDLDKTETEAKEEKAVHINQLGFLPAADKEVIVAEQAEEFKVVAADTKEVVHKGELTGGIKDEASGDTVYYGDFSSLEEIGEYYVAVPGVGESYTFAIKTGVYDDLKQGIQKMFYYQRCGSQLTEEYAGVWSHEACQTEKAVIYNTEETKEVTGGWHDAGDYGRYSVPAAKAAADLMLSYQFFPDRLDTDNTNIPESGSGLPDILDQVEYEINWLLKMQDDDSGGVYHKVTTANFQDHIWPEKVTDELILSPISAAATADFAAVMAMAARVYEPIDGDLAQRYLKAAKNAWSWLEKNKEVSGFTNPEEIVTGEYGDDEDGDERYWAAVELYLVTGKEKYHQYLKESFNQNAWSGLSWADVGDYGTISYLFADEEKQDSKFYTKLKNKFVSRGKELAEKSAEDGYGISLGTDYHWGSNMTAANNAVHLLLAAKLTDNPQQYMTAAKNHLDYLLGRNALSQSYITGYGDNAAENPHHRLSAAADKTVPGMVVGGPNAGLQDPLAKSRLEGKPPAKCYIDEEPSYSTNEITIYWNSPVLFLVTQFTK